MSILRSVTSGLTHLEIVRAVSNLFHITTKIPRKVHFPLNSITYAHLFPLTLFNAPARILSLAIENTSRNFPQPSKFAFKI